MRRSAQNALPKLVLRSTTTTRDIEGLVEQNGDPFFAIVVWRSQMDLLLLACFLDWFLHHQWVRLNGAKWAFPFWPNKWNGYATSIVVVTTSQELSCRPPGALSAAMTFDFQRSHHYVSLLR